MKKVVIAGGGFAGLNAAKMMGKAPGKVEVTLIDRNNHHLFQPLLYQVAMAGLSPAEIAAPIRSLLSAFRNIRVIQANVTAVHLEKRQLQADCGNFDYDYLLLACGAQHTYFGNDDWEKYAPGLKSIEQATEIRRRVLEAFEKAEIESDPKAQKSLLTFVIVGAGPTGVELAGAIGEMSRFTLARDFRNIDPKRTRVILIEAGPRILPGFHESLSAKAARQLEKLGVQVWVSSRVTQVDLQGVELGEERLRASTVLWAAGVEASGLGKQMGVDVDPQGRILVESDLSLADYPKVFVAGDQARFEQEGKLLPGQAPVALQQGRCIARNILREIDGQQRQPFRYLDKGQMATIGRSRAVLESGRVRLSGFLAWLAWLVVHIYYLTGFKNRLFVVIQWAWAYLSFRRGARLIVDREWRIFKG